MLYGNGDFYKGHFKDGKMDGPGKMISLNGQIVYEGPFKNDFKWGEYGLLVDNVK